jgi:hypothetical protein
VTSEHPAVLVVASDSRRQAWIARILRTVVASAAAVPHLDGHAHLADLELVAIDFDGIDERDRALLFSQDHSPEAPGPRLLLISSSGDYQRLFVELANHRITNLFARDGVVEAKDLIVTVQKILRRDVFGLGKYFGWGVEFTMDRLHASEERNAVVDRTVAFASSLDIHPRLVENIATALEELVTNALYDAPTDAEGQPRFTHLPRTAPITLDPGEEILVQVCCDGETFGISVTDPFGSLTTERSLTHLVRSFHVKQQPTDTKKGGAGLGLFMTFDSLNHMVVNICRNTRTEVIGLIDVRGNYRDFVHRGKAFNIFLCAGEKP